MESIRTLFEALKNKGLTSTKFAEKIYKLKEGDIVELVEAMANGVYTDNLDVDKGSQFNFIANNTLSGGPFPCAEFRCRVNNIDNLARNSILYADTVFISNPFEKYFHYDSISLRMRHEIATDLALLYYIKPLLEEGIFRFSSSTLHICKECLKKVNVFSKGYGKKIDRAENKLFDIILEDFSFKVRDSKDESLTVEIQGPADFLEHPMILKMFDNESVMLAKSLNRPRKLSHEEVVKLGIPEFFIHHITDDLVTQNYYSNIFNSYYLTNRNIDSRIIIENQSKKERQFDQVISENINHSLPYVQDTDFKRLIKFRKNEGEAFQIYRASLSNFLKNMKSTDYDVKQSFKDEIEPEIFKMDQTIRTNKKLIYADLKKDVFVGTTFVSIGLFTNIIPHNVSQILAGVGGINYVNKFGDNIKKLTSLEEEIRANKYFFVWKLKKNNLLNR